MNHLSLRGTHWEMGFQWGTRLAERGRFLLDHVPFPLTAERRAFAAACRPAYARYFPVALEELAGLAAGQSCRQEDLEAVLFTTYALPPACGCSCLAVSNGSGRVLRPEQRLSDGAGTGLTLTRRTSFPAGPSPLRGNTTSLRPDGGRRQRPGAGRRPHLRLHAPAPAGPERRHGPAAAGGDLRQRGGGPGPPSGAAPGLLPDADAGGRGRGHRRGGVRSGGGAGGAARPSGTLRLCGESLPLGPGGPAAAGAGHLACGGAV